MDDLRDHVRVILARPRFPENIGMTARACANMGVGQLALTAPELWPDVWPCANADAPGREYVEKALTSATGAGREVVENLRVFADLPSALADRTLSFGATARTGGWRQEILTPSAAAEQALEHLRAGGRVAYVFGPEDQGLSNADIECCAHLVNIPTAAAPSLNLAQAVLILLYELARAHPFGGAERPARPGRIQTSPFITQEQTDLLLERVRAAMLALESLPEDNSGYFLLPLRRLAARTRLRHNEFSMLMGVCGKILRLAGRSGQQ